VRTVAAFDFDGTLAERDSFLPFLRRVCGARELAVALALATPHLARAAGGGDRDPVKSALVGRLLAGRRVDDLEPAVRAYAEHVVASCIRGDVLERVEWHRRGGHELVIVSASPELYLVPVGQLLGFDAVLATRLEVDAAGRFTGRLDGRNVRGPEKTARLRAHVGDGPVRLWAYGDSAGDRELLALADVVTRVNRRRLPAAPGAGGRPATNPTVPPTSLPSPPPLPRDPEPGTGG
jgi:phosphatidylglycerophosphatase C